MSISEDPLLTDYREDVSQLLLQRGLDHRIGEDDELALAACWDRGQPVAIAATRIAAARRSSGVQSPSLDDMVRNLPLCMEGED